jgi:hypothetical protein
MTSVRTSKRDRNMLDIKKYVRYKIHTMLKIILWNSNLHIFMMKGIRLMRFKTEQTKV